MQKILFIDHRDSFVFNIIRMIEQCGDCKISRVFSNELKVVDFKKFDTIILSPGPGLPSEANGFTECLQNCFNTHKILGICLGHQAIVEFFCGRVVKMPKVRHGHKTSLNIIDSNDKLLNGISNQSQVCLYNSWTVDPLVIPNCLIVSSVDSEQNIMSVYHSNLPIHGIQFHPESIGSNCGKEIFSNFLKL